MNNKVLKTKRNLTIMFTVIVSLVIIILGFSFFSIKYYKELTNEKENFDNVGKGISTGDLSVENFLGLLKFIGNNLERHQIGEKFKKKDNLGPGEKDFISSVSYIYVKEEIYQESDDLLGDLIKTNEVLSFDIREDVTSDFVKNLLESEIFNDSFELDGFLIKKIDLGNEKLIIFKKLRYSLSDYLSDMIIFIFVTFIFSSLLYLIGRKFIDGAFKPVEENISDMNNFIHNAGHELKTPLSVIDSNIQLIKDIKNYNESMLDEIKNETIKLNGLIDSLIKLSDIGDFKVEKEKINLKEIIEEIVNNFKQKSLEKNIDIKLRIKKDIYIDVPKSYLYILISNIIGNAIKYNKKAGKINISYKQGELIIKDTGEGISKDNLNKIFDRFYKIDSSRNSEGFGIGLSLVKKIANIYKWKIKVNSEEGKGSSFIVKF